MPQNSFAALQSHDCCMQISLVKMADCGFFPNNFNASRIKESSRNMPGYYQDSAKYLDAQQASIISSCQTFVFEAKIELKTCKFNHWVHISPRSLEQE